MRRHKIGERATSEAEALFQMFVDMAGGSARRRLEAYQEARQLRRNICGLDEEPPSLVPTPSRRLRALPRHAWERARKH